MAMEEGMKKLEENISDIKSDISRNLVSMKHFEAVTDPLQEQISEIQKDIKSILLILSKNGTSKSKLLE